MQRKKSKSALSARPVPVVGETLLQAEPVQEGLPNPASVIGEQTLVSPKGRKYTILKTTEVDAYEKRKGKRRTRK
jgi:hypothetical protein